MQIVLIGPALLCIDRFFAHRGAGSGRTIAAYAPGKSASKYPLPHLPLEPAAATIEL